MALVHYCCACMQKFSNKTEVIDMSHNEMTKIMMVAVPESNISYIKDPVICIECCEKLKTAYNLKIHYNNIKKQSKIEQDINGQKINPCSVMLYRIDEQQFPSK